MRIIARRTLREFVEKRAGRKDRAALKAALDAWFWEVSRANWRGAVEVKTPYRTAAILILALGHDLMGEGFRDGRVSDSSSV
jgi:mRNA interferase HigB